MSKNISLLQKAIKLHSQGKISDAKKYYERILKEDSNLPDCYNNLGVIFKDNYKDLPQAESLFKKAVSLRPENKNYLRNLADTILERGDFKQASDCFLSLIKAGHNDPEIILNFLIASISNNSLDEAIAFIQEQPSIPVYESLLYCLFIALAPSYTKHYIIDESIGFLSTFFSKENSKSESKILEEISLPYSSDCLLLDLIPRLLEYDFYDENLEFLFNLLEKSKCDKRLDTRYFYLGLGQSRLGNYSAAVLLYKKSLKINPNNSALYPYLAQALVWAGFITEGFSLNQKKHLLTPITVVHLLNKRNFDAAWKLYMSYEQHKYRKAPLPSYFIDNTHSSVLVYRDQGIGDEILFFSCLQDILSQDILVYVECSPRLHSILKRSFPAVRQFFPFDPLDKTRKKFSYLSDFSIDSAIRASRLPQLFRRSLDAFPRHRGYLKPDPSKLTFWRERLAACGNRLKVGIAWKGGINFRRGIKHENISALDPLFKIDGIDWINLQYGNIEYEKKYFFDAHGIELLCWPDIDITNDFENLSALLSQLDLVIQVSNTSLHLAGALGVECWALLTHESFDMRWFEGNSPTETPWYPSVKLYRQNDQESIYELLIRVSENLTQRLNSND